MAGSNFRGTRRTLYNPQTVKYLSAPEAKSAYQALRRVAMKREARLERAGLQSHMSIELPPASTLSPDQISGALLDVSQFLRDPRSLVRPAREFEEKQQAAFADSPVIKKNIKAFGDFMSDMRRRAGGRLYDSSRTRDAYEQVVSKGMRPATLEKHFGKYLTDAAEAEKIAKAAAGFTGRRLTISVLKGLL